MSAHRKSSVRLSPNIARAPGGHNWMCIRRTGTAPCFASSRSLASRARILTHVSACDLGVAVHHRVGPKPGGLKYTSLPKERIPSAPTGYGLPFLSSHSILLAASTKVSVGASTSRRCHIVLDGTLQQGSLGHLPPCRQECYPQP